MIFDNKPLEFPESITIAENEFRIKVNFYKKKNSSVSIKGNQLDFRLSQYLSRKQKERHFQDLLKKIAQKIEKSPGIIRNNDGFKNALEKGEFMFSDTKYFLEYTKNRGTKLKENTFYINHHTKQDQIEKKIIKLLRERYEDRIKSYVFQINESSYNYEIKDVQLKLVESKWGHCSHDNEIMINLKLLNADPEVLNYVIYHELAHIKVKNHSESFWREVYRFCPNYKVLRKKLRQNPPEVFV